jgi:Probable zinc-ribbon domain
MPDDLVPHPRYGEGPCYTRLDLDGEEPHFEASGYRDGDQIIRGTGIKARPMFMGPTMYFDILKTCMDCGRHFIFYAAEQKHWHEDLGFSTAADCVRCIDCRKQQQSDERSHADYQRLLSKEHRSLNDLSDFVSAALDLRRQGKLKSFQKVRESLNAATDAHPDSQRQKGIAELREQIKNAEQGDGDGE